MAEHSFQEVMRQWVRARKAIVSSTEENVLSVYPLEVYDDALIATLEENIMQWAAENPEPVYPSWREWLIKKGLIDFKPDFKSLSYDPSLDLQENPVIECLNVKASEPIPADIAREAGIAAKGGIAWTR